MSFQPNPNPIVHNVWRICRRPFRTPQCMTDHGITILSHLPDFISPVKEAVTPKCVIKELSSLDAQPSELSQLDLKGKPGCAMSPSSPKEYATACYRQRGIRICQ